MLSTPLGNPDLGAELRPLEPWQADAFAAYTDKHRDHLAPWLPWARSVVDEETARAFLQRYADTTARDGGRIYSILQHGEMVGGTLFRVFDPVEHTCEVGVWLSPGATGQGLVTLAVRAMVAWATEVRGMRRVEWCCVPENEPSRAAARRLGFTHETTREQAFEHDGRRWDLEVWALTTGG